MNREKQRGLWTRDFIIIIIGTIISAIGDLSLDFAMSLSVFDETSSTWLSGSFSAISLLPGVLIPIVAAPLVDKCNRKFLIVLTDGINSIVFVLFFVFMQYRGFDYNAYIIFQLITSSIGSFNYLAYSAFYPVLIPKGYTQKGYAVSAMLYPTVAAVMTPCSALVYSTLGLELIVLAEGILLAITAVFESRISVSGKPVNDPSKKVENKNPLKEYFKEICEGFTYLKQEKGLRKLYSYMALTNASAVGNQLMVRAYFQSSPFLTTAMYSFLTTAEMAGRMFGGITHYFIEIPEDKKYKAARIVYALYDTGDGIMLFLAYPLMIVLRFVSGFLGINSASLREAAVSRYLPNHIRARVAAVITTVMQAVTLLANVLIGAIGEIADYRMIVFCVSISTLISMYLLIVRGRKDVERVFSVHLDDVASAD